MSASYWRKKAAPIIAEVLAATVGQPEDVIVKALRDAYPFGPREHHPYKIWLDEIKAQRGLKVKKTARGTKVSPALHDRLAEVKAGRW